jgi:hypothetical protein
MEKTDLLNTIFDSFIEEMKSQKEDLISAVAKKEFKMDRFKNCPRIKTIVAHLFFMAILKNSPTDENILDDTDPFVNYIRWQSVFVKPLDKHVLPVFRELKKSFSPKHDKFQLVKTQAKTLFNCSVNNLNAAKALKVNEFFSQCVQYSQLAAELAIKSILKAKRISHSSWKCEHSIINLCQLTGCIDKRFIDICETLETLGLNKWINVEFEKSSTLSIRTWYCDYNNDAFLYVKTMPNEVFQSNLAHKAFVLSEKISICCEFLLSEACGESTVRREP